MMMMKGSSAMLVFFLLEGLNASGMMNGMNGQQPQVPQVIGQPQVMTLEQLLQLQQIQQQQQLQQQQPPQQQQQQPQGVQISQPPVATSTTVNSSNPLILTLKPNNTSNAKTPTTAFTLPPGFSAGNDQTCQEVWSQVDALLEDVLEEHPDSPHHKTLLAFQKIVEDVGMPNLIDAVSSTMGNKGVRTLVRETDKLKKKFLQLANRKAVLDKHPEYQSLVEAFKQLQATQANDAMSQLCFLPAQLTSFILHAIQIEDETEHELVNFQEPVVHIVETIVTAVKKANKRRGGKEPKGIVLEKQEVKLLEGFLKALKSRKGRHRSDDGEGGMGGSVVIIAVVLVIVLIAIIVGVVFLMKRK